MQLSGIFFPKSTDTKLVCINWWELCSLVSTCFSFFFLPAKYVRMSNFSGTSKQAQVVYTVNWCEFVLFVIYLLMSYSPFWNSFQWELVFCRNQSIHFFCTWSEPFLSDMHFHWVEFTNSLEGYNCPLRLFLWASLCYNLSHSHTFFYYWCFWVIKRVSSYLYSMPVSLAQLRGEII